tara:strand:+ start:26193 stop:27437 length:1245 start_codon:yes stop_codon:yes gene_type:complete
MNLSKELKERGFIYQTTTENLSELLDGGSKTIYQGIDPSANSAHAGNVVLWFLLSHLIKAGHKVIFLVGGATGMIGDPKPDAERELLDPETVQKNITTIKQQAENFFGEGVVEFVNNYDWFSEVKLIDFLRDTGKHFTVNELLKRDAISKRLEGDTGLSYTEFAYPLIQGFDFLHLYQNKGCEIQVGGSDQWGNMVSGVDLIRRKTGAEAVAITTPLVVDKATGKKFGKSEGNAVWLDPMQTTPYEFYQFWLNASDESVVDYLKLFTFLSLDEIDTLKQEFETNPGNRLAQKTLAFEVTKVVHGTEAAEAARRVSQILFGGESVSELSDLEKEMLLQTAPSSSLMSVKPVVDILVDTGLAISKREARMFIDSNAVELQGEMVTDAASEIDPIKHQEDFLIIRRGKKQIHILKIK